jgi:hypothetical protein
MLNFNKESNNYLVSSLELLARRNIQCDIFEML